MAQPATSLVEEKPQEMKLKNTQKFTKQ